MHDRYLARHQAISGFVERPSTHDIDADQSGWEFRISIFPTQANLNRAAAVLAPLLCAEDLQFKILALNDPEETDVSQISWDATHLTIGNTQCADRDQRGKEVCIYARFDKHTHTCERTPAQWKALMLRCWKALQDAHVQIGYMQPLVGDRTIPVMNGALPSIFSYTANKPWQGKHGVLYPEVYKQEALDLVTHAGDACTRYQVEETGLLAGATPTTSMAAIADYNPLGFANPFEGIAFTLDDLVEYGIDLAEVVQLQGRRVGYLEGHVAQARARLSQYKERAIHFWQQVSQQNGSQSISDPLRTRISRVFNVLKGESEMLDLTAAQRGRDRAARITAMLDSLKQIAQHFPRQADGALSKTHFALALNDFIVTFEKMQQAYQARVKSCQAAAQQTGAVVTQKYEYELDVAYHEEIEAFFQQRFMDKQSFLHSFPASTEADNAVWRAECAAHGFGDWVAAYGDFYPAGLQVLLRRAAHVKNEAAMLAKERERDVSDFQPFTEMHSAIVRLSDTHPQQAKLKNTLRKLYREVLNQTLSLEDITVISHQINRMVHSIIHDGVVDAAFVKGMTPDDLAVWQDISAKDNYVYRRDNDNLYIAQKLRCVCYFEHKMRELPAFQVPAQRWFRGAIAEIILCAVGAVIGAVVGAVAEGILFAVLSAPVGGVAGFIGAAEGAIRGSMVGWSLGMLLGTACGYAAARFFPAHKPSTLDSVLMAARELAEAPAKGGSEMDEPEASTLPLLVSA